MTVENRIEEAIEDRVGAPFDRVRLVDQANDVISPDFPEEDLVVVAESVKKRKKGVLDRPKKQAVFETEDGKPRRITLKLKNPNTNEAPKVVKKVKEIDSDGDTVGGWSDEENGVVGSGSALSSLTSLSKSASPVPARFAFLPRASTMDHPNLNLNDYLSSIAEPVVQHDHLRPPTYLTLPAPLNDHEPLSLRYGPPRYSYSPPSRRLPPLPLPMNEPFVHRMGEACPHQPWTSDLDHISLAAAEARNSPSYGEFAPPFAPPPQSQQQHDGWMDKVSRQKNLSEDDHHLA